MHNNAETLFERLEAKGLTWRVYCDAPSPASFTGIIHASRLRNRFATNFSTVTDFLDDARAGRLPTYSFIEPNMWHGHNDMHPPVSTLMHGLAFDEPSSLLGGEALLSSIYDAVRTSSSSSGSNYLNTLLLVTFDEAGGTYDHVPPPPAPPPDAKAPAGQMGFTFNRSGQRVPAIAISAWIPEQTVVTDEYRHTSLIRTMRERWSLGDSPTARDAIARDIGPILSLNQPRSPDQWPDAVPRPVPKFDAALLPPDRPLSVLGRGLLPPNWLHKPHNLPGWHRESRLSACVVVANRRALVTGQNVSLCHLVGAGGGISRRTPLRRPHVFARRPGKSSKAPLRIMSVACAPVSLVSAGIVGTCAPRCFSNSSTACLGAGAPRRRLHDLDAHCKRSDGPTWFRTVGPC